MKLRAYWSFKMMFVVICFCVCIDFKSSFCSLSVRRWKEEYQRRESRKGSSSQEMRTSTTMRSLRAFLFSHCFSFILHVFFACKVNNWFEQWPWKSKMLVTLVTPQDFYLYFANIVQPHDVERLSMWQFKQNIINSWCDFNKYWKYDKCN